jgi:hypothetical protein
MASILYEFYLIYIDCYFLFQLTSAYIASVHDDTSLGIDTFNSESEGIKQFDCPLCLSCFTTMETMKSHVSEVHSHDLKEYN